MSVVLYNRKLHRPKYEVVQQDTIGREKTCTVTTAEIYAIKEALVVFQESRSSGWIMTDSQEALRLIEARGKSSKSREAVLATLRAFQDLREAGLFAKILWIPGHKGIEGNERAHQAAQEMTMLGKTPTADMTRRVREHCMLSKLLQKAVEADAPETASTWGRYTYAMDSALPGKHTLQLYGPLSREDSGILAQARTGHTHLNEYRARIKQADSPLCDCNGGVESVKHVLLHCPMWTTERQHLREVAGNRWGDVSFLLGGKSRKCDPRTGESMDGDKWKPDTKVVRETIAFLKSTGRFSAQMPIFNSSQQCSH
jgi:ribonuclease HI